MTLLGVAVLSLSLLYVVYAQTPAAAAPAASAPAASAPAPATASAVSPRVALPPAGPNNANIAVSKRVIDSPLQDIQWSSENFVFVLSEKGKVFLSSDGGRSWENQIPKLTVDVPPKIIAMYISEVDSKYVILVGEGSDNFVTTDLGKTWTPSKLAIRDVRLHPRRKELVLASAMSAGCAQASRTTSPATAIGRVNAPAQACFKELYVSKDFGASWTKIVSYVVQFDWSPVYGEADEKGAFPSDDVIFVTAHESKTGEQKFGFWDKDIHFMSSTDYFATTSVLVKYGNRFLFGDYSYLFVATVDPVKTTEVSLMISRDNSSHLLFQPAILPVELTEHSYTILDTSEGAVFLHVNHRPFNENADTGHVYLSDWSGLVFSLSLPYNHRSPDGKCDFEKVEGLEGIYLANFIDVDERDRDEERDERRPSRQQPGRVASKKSHARTVITFDKGAVWSYLSPPTKDSQGNAIDCQGECHLHLHGITDLYGPFYSTASATGLIMATGTVGPYLQAGTSQINTYLSRDAGYSWLEVRKGSHIYEFGDHGGLVVMAPDDTETDTILYSWTEGLTWYSLQIHDSPFQIENIIIEPNSQTLQFIVYGWKASLGVMVYLDFAELHGRQCVGQDAPDTAISDYETWSPNDGRTGENHCLMGRKVQYTRRKASSECFNPEKFERPIMHEHCACTADDFQCDYGYERITEVRTTAEHTAARAEDSKDEFCRLSAVEPKHQDPTQSNGDDCVGHYRITKGYRRVPGDTCVGGGTWDAQQIPCANSMLSSHGAKVVLILLVLVGVSLLLVTAVSKYDNILDIFTWVGFKRCVAGIISTVTMGRVGSKTVHATDGWAVVGSAQADPEADHDSFVADDFGSPSAQLITPGGGAGRRPRRGDNEGGDEMATTAATNATPFATLPVTRRAGGPVPRLAPPQRGNDPEAGGL